MTTTAFVERSGLSVDAQDRSRIAASRLLAASTAASMAFVTVSSCHWLLESKMMTVHNMAVLLRGIAFHVAWNGPRLGLYDPFKTAFRESGFVSESFSRLGAASLAASVASVMGTPVQALTHEAPEVVAGRRSSLLQRLPGLIRASIVRTHIVSLAQLPTYDAGKDFLRDAFGVTEGSALQRVPAAIAASATVVAAVHPYDRIAEGIAALASKPSRDSLGFLSSARALIKSEGFPWLYRGWLTHYGRLGTHIVITTLTLEELKPIYAQYALS